MDPVGLAVDSDGSAIIANECPGGAGLVRVSSTGAQSQVTPNAATGDVLRTPERVGVTPAGDYLVSDFNGGSDGDGSIDSRLVNLVLRGSGARLRP